MGQYLGWMISTTSFYHQAAFKCFLTSQLVVILWTLLCFFSLSLGYTAKATIRLEHLKLLLLLESQRDLMVLDFRRANLEVLRSSKELGGSGLVVLAGTA